jgi:flotillin
MTRETLQFLLPVVVTVGPNVTNHQTAKDDTARLESDQASPLEKYAMFQTSAKNPNSSQVQSIVNGIIEGETRALVTSMVIEGILADLNSFKKTLSNNIQSELDHFGLKVYNAEVKELR